MRYVPLPDGTRVRVIESIPEQRDAVLLVHGWGGSVYSFSETIPAIAAAGYRAIAFDLPGHGLSDKPLDDGRYTVASLADTIIAVADAMGLRRFALVGHSLGALLALELAIRGEKRVERVVLINPPGFATSPMIAVFKALSPRFTDRFLPTLISRRIIALTLARAFATRERPLPRDIDEYWAPTQFDAFTLACRQCLHEVRWNRLPATTLKSLRLPVLVIIGGRDHIIRDDARRVKLIPTAQVVTLPEGGHLVMQECATKANSKILLFLPGGRGRR